MTKLKYLLLFVFLIGAFFLLNILNDPDNFLKKGSPKHTVVYEPSSSRIENPQTTENLFPESGQENYDILKVGDGLYLDSDNYFTFVRVKEDNRCPRQIVCEVSGKATIELVVENKKVNNFKAQVEELKVEGLNRVPQDGELKPSLFYPKEILTSDGKKYMVTLRDLSPYPEKDFFTDLKQIKYVGLFYIEKLK